MGDPKKLKKKYSTPPHPWERQRMEEESLLLKEYALKNKKEIWKVAALLRKYTGNAKKLITSRTKQADIERYQLLTKLQRLGLIQEGSRIEDILSLTIRDFMERRLQSIVFKKGLARSMKQARQFITHQHIVVGDKKISVPSYIVLKEEEPLVAFTNKSALSNPEHPERKLRETSASDSKSDSKDVSSDTPSKDSSKISSANNDSEKKINKETNKDLKKNSNEKSLAEPTKASNDPKPDLAPQKEEISDAAQSQTSKSAKRENKGSTAPHENPAANKKEEVKNVEEVN